MSSIWSSQEFCHWQILLCRHEDEKYLLLDMITFVSLLAMTCAVSVDNEATASQMCPLAVPSSKTTGIGCSCFNLASQNSAGLPHVQLLKGS